ncbi:hypothetical protein KBX53_00730 [Micromonospora sp. M51]|uniref:hypothetical protein n=1 Tax=Micromonospora sp. M51 TaxID=2824889 RepID=UPI001B36567C|nr:hypothetical protein [Micromonospora sp. M51]MBQ1009504.1 hypothetical protein [Micromonospora sp. M51]
MSVDLEATVARPISLAEVVTAARATLAELLGMTTTPELIIVTDRRYEQGRRVDSGRRLDAAELRATTIGDRIDRTPDGMPGAIHLEVDVAGFEDSVWLLVIDHEPETDTGPEAVFSPYRTCVGVVVALAMALAVTDLTGGQFTDDQIRLLRPGHSDPRQVVTATRLPPEPGDFAERCERYIRQFAHLRGWPRDVSMRP